MEKQKQRAYQLLLFNDEPLNDERRLWLGLCNLEDSQDRLRKSIFRKLTELEKENEEIKKQIWDLKSEKQQLDMFSDFFEYAK